MLKALLAATILAFSSYAFSENVAKNGADSSQASCKSEPKCSDDPAAPGPGIDLDYVVKQINKADSCEKAAEIVKGCALGASGDGMSVGAAIDVCDKKTGKLNGVDKGLKDAMNKRCDKVCDRKNDGTMCISRQAFCRLRVSEYMSSVSWHY